MILANIPRSEEHTSELQSRLHLVCRLLLEKKYSLFMFHSTKFMVAINRAIVAIGLSFIQVGAFNSTMEYTPLLFSGVSLGMSVVLVLIGSSISPPFPPIYMQTH